MLNRILEISKRASKGGRVPIKIALLKIHQDDEETNKNGLHWKEEYVANAIESVKMMPICAAFVDEDKSIPLDHGLTSFDIDDEGVCEPLFENSDTVGAFEEGAIEDVVINGEEIKALVASGYLFNQRYPEFVKWVRKNHALGQVSTSVEIMGIDSNDNKVVYDEDEPTQEFRTPKEFVFSGCAILSVAPADDDAIVLEVAQKQTEKEDVKVNEQELKALIQDTITETNNQNDELNKQISELNTQISEKDNQIVELNATVEQLKAELAKMNEEQDTWWEERDILRKNIAEIKVEQRLAELDEAVSEYSDEEKACAAEDIEKLKAEINDCKSEDELAKVSSEINTIVSKICREIVAKQKQAEAEQRTAELNAQQKQKDTETVDIFSEVCENTAKDDGEDIDIFG